MTMPATHAARISSPRSMTTAYLHANMTLNGRVREPCRQSPGSWSDPSQQLLREPRDDVKHPVDDLGDVVLHPGAHQESDLAARQLVILLQPGRETRGRGTERLVE